MKFKKGDKVIMLDCIEAEHHKGKVWTVCKDERKQDGNQVVMLEGFSSWFDVSKLRKYMGKCPHCGDNMWREEKAKIIFLTCIKCKSMGITLVMNSEDSKDWVWECNACGYKEKYQDEHKEMAEHATIIAPCIKCKSREVLLLKNSKEPKDWVWKCKVCGHEKKYQDKHKYLIRNARIVIPTGVQI